MTNGKREELLKTTGGTYAQVLSEVGPHLADVVRGVFEVASVLIEVGGIEDGKEQHNVFPLGHSPKRF